MDPNVRGVLIGLLSITAVCGQCCIGYMAKRCAYGLHRTAFGFFARQGRWFNGSYSLYSSCHDHRHGGVSHGG